MRLPWPKWLGEAHSLSWHKKPPTRQGERRGNEDYLTTVAPVAVLAMSGVPTMVVFTIVRVE